jgi:hypothetical protein
MGEALTALGSLKPAECSLLWMPSLSKIKKIKKNQNQKLINGLANVSSMFHRIFLYCIENA